MENAISIVNTVRIKNNEIYLNQEKILSGDLNTDVFLSAAYKSLDINYPKFYKMDMMSKGGFIAAEILLKHDINTNIHSFEKGMIFQNTFSSLEADRKYSERLTEAASPALFVYTLPNIVMGEIAIRHAFKGENIFFVSERFNAVQLIDYAEIVFNQQILQTALIGYIDCNKGILDILLCQIIQDDRSPLSVQSLNNLYNN